MALLAPAVMFGQAADALLDKLVQKGVLTVDEANDLRQQSDNDFTRATQIKNGMPDWVESFKINGDFRGRLENYHSDNPLWVSRTRYRYRARLQFDAVIAGNIDVIIRFAGADPASASTLGGGSPVSANTTFGGGDSRKPVYFDAAYAKWSPVQNGDWTASIMLGKLDSPFQVSNMVLDYDFVPEGVAGFVSHRLNDRHSLKIIGGLFALYEINQQVTGNLLSPSHDPNILAGQIVWDANWTRKLSTELGLGVFSLDGRSNLGVLPGDPANLIYYNDGNTRDANGNLVYGYNPIVVSANATYNLAGFPLYSGEFPFQVFGEYMNNPNAPTQNEGYRVGVSLGKADARGRWEISYRYQSLGADAWYDAVVDDDNGAFYQQPLTGSPYINTGNNSLGYGWRGGTNVRGHLITFRYAFTEYASFTMTYYLNTLIHAVPAGSISAAGHMMADVSLRF